MDDDKLTELKDNFDHFDRDDNGQIDFAEFQELMAALDAGLSASQARIGFDAIDEDANARIDFAEFTTRWSNR